MKKSNNEYHRFVDEAGDTSLPRKALWGQEGVSNDNKKNPLTAKNKISPHIH